MKVSFELPSTNELIMLVAENRSNMCLNHKMLATVSKIHFKTKIYLDYIFGLKRFLTYGTKELFFPGDKNKINHGGVPMAPCLFQDDIIHGAKDLKS